MSIHGDLANCYAAALGRQDLGELRPGGLALHAGVIDRQTYNTLWNNPTKNLRVYMGACLSGMSLDGLELLNSPDLPRKGSKDHLIGAFTRVYKGDPDFHFAYARASEDVWYESRRHACCADEELFLVEDKVRDVKGMADTGLLGYEFLVFARITERLHAMMRFQPHP